MISNFRFVVCLLAPSFSSALVIVLILTLVVVISLFFQKARRRRTSASTTPFPEWAPDKPWESLKAVFAATLQQGESAIEWYRDNIRSKRVGAQLIRLFSILLASIGALVPLVVAAARNFQGSQRIFDPQWGYFSFATAAVLIAVDKFYGFSSGWVRYIKTQLALERSLSDLRYDWTGLVSKVQNGTPSADQIQVMLQKLKDFVDFVHSQVQQETEAWVLEFQTSLSDLMTSVKAQSETTKPGSIQVTVANAADFETVTAILDQVTELTVQGGQCLFPSVAPGAHIISARGKKGEKTLTAGDVVKVGPSALATVSIAIPVS